MTPSFSPNEAFDRTFLLKNIDERRTKNGKPYLALVLGTSDGAWEARIWDMGMSSLPGLVEGDPVQAAGSAQIYQDKVQLIVETIAKVPGPVDPRVLYPASVAGEEVLRQDFQKWVRGLTDPHLKRLMETMMGDGRIFDAYFTSPAAITMHHARIGGLAEHSLGVCRLAQACTATAPWLNRDLLTVGALLHDVGKVLEYEVAGDFRYTLEGKLLGHIVLGNSLVESWIGQMPGFPERLALEILHIILSHHGQLEFGSPKTPATPEALVIHYADDLDAKLDMVREAGEGPDTGEAFVRGLRRSFLFRNEGPDPGTPFDVVQDKRGPSLAKAADGRHGDTGEKGTQTPSGKGSEAQVRGPALTPPDDEDAEPGESPAGSRRDAGMIRKRGGQEELF